VLARLEKEGLTPVRPASRLTLLRRATLDLTGLPPSPEDIEAFEKDTAPDAFAKVIDRLLATPQYGETWGRLWLDVARYGEDDYRSLDPKGRGLNPYPNAYLYRDWVIKAFNDDMPYDQFVRVQIAGELLGEFLRTESEQLGETLALQASKYMVAAWKVTGEPKEDIAKVVDAEKLDFELFDRWLKFLAKPPKFYPNLTKWQEMVKGGGKE